MPPLPGIRPMILTRFSEPFSDPDWIFEIKHDGFRALAYVVEGHCQLVSRRNYAYKSFGTLCESIAGDLQVEDAVLDGEIVCLDENGHSQFNRLMYRRGDPYFYAFDLLWLNGEDLRGWPLLDRKQALKKVMPSRQSRLLYVDHIVGRGRGPFCIGMRRRS